MICFHFQLDDTTCQGYDEFREGFRFTPEIVAEIVCFYSNNHGVERMEFEGGGEEKRNNITFVSILLKQTASTLTGENITRISPVIFSIVKCTLPIS